MLFRSPAWDSVIFWAVDLETGGLDVKRDPILSVGMVPIRAGVVRLGESFQSLVRTEGWTEISPQSIAMHQLLPEEMKSAPSLSAVLKEIDLRLRQGVLLVHHRRIEERFLRREFVRARMRWPRAPVVDTLQLARKLERASDPHASRDARPLTLSAVRRRFGLPDYPAHDALMDAIATAELFLVLRHAAGASTLRHLG